jgi:hypothetical protein
MASGESYSTKGRRPRRHPGTLRDNPYQGDAMRGIRRTTVIRRTVEILAVVLVVAAIVPGWRADRWVFGGGRGERGFYMKLPLEQPRFHWYFQDESAFLAGSLKIEIHRDSRRDTTLTVFEAGHFAPGWAPINRDQRGIYFGFVGGESIWTEPADSLVVTLEVTHDLQGIGAYRKGVLSAGRYQAVASYGRLTGHPDFGLLGRHREPTAFVSCWRSQWPLQVTEDRGWQGSVAEQPNPFGDGWVGRMEARLLAPHGTDGVRCVE